MTWSHYYQRNEGRMSSPLLQQAMDLCSTPTRQAVDLGCGNSIETRELLCKGWHVHALDSEPEAIARAHGQAAACNARHRLSTEVIAFEDLSTLPASDLVFAGFALPFCHPLQFHRLWSLVLSHLRPGGVFAGHLFGVNDAWANNPAMTFLSRQECLDLLADMDLKLFEETDAPGPSMQGGKHWHGFDFLAMRR